MKPPTYVYDERHRDIMEAREWRGQSHDLDSYGMLTVNDHEDGWMIRLQIHVDTSYAEQNHASVAHWTGETWQQVASVLPLTVQRTYLVLRGELLDRGAPEYDKNLALPLLAVRAHLLMLAATVLGGGE